MEKRGLQLHGLVVCSLEGAAQSDGKGIDAEQMGRPHEAAAADRLCPSPVPWTKLTRRLLGRSSGSHFLLRPHPQHMAFTHTPSSMLHPCHTTCNGTRYTRTRTHAHTRQQMSGSRGTDTKCSLTGGLKRAGRMEWELNIEHAHSTFVTSFWPLQLQAVVYM